jgi:hypothetical protein
MSQQSLTCRCYAGAFFLPRSYLVPTHAWRKADDLRKRRQWTALREAVALAREQFDALTIEQDSLRMRLDAAEAERDDLRGRLQAPGTAYGRPLSGWRSWRWQRSAGEGRGAGHGYGRLG